MGVLASVLGRALRTCGGASGWRRLVWVGAAAFASVVLVGAALLSARTCAAWARQRGGSAQLVVYLTPDTGAAERQALAGELSALGGVTAVQVVAPDEALRRLRSALATDQALLDGVEPETMPASLEAALEPGVEAVLPMSPTFSALRRHPSVEDVVIEPAPPDSLASAMARVAPWGRSLALAIGGLVALLTFAVARHAWALPRQELAVARLLGAGPAFQLVPRAIGAAIASSSGAFLGVVTLLAGGLQLTAALAPSPSSSSLPLVPGVALLGAGDAALLVLATALLAGAGAARAVIAREATDG